MSKGERLRGMSLVNLAAVSELTPPCSNDGHAIFSRAYVLLSSVEAVAEFHRGYDGHVFRSKTGRPVASLVIQCLKSL